MIKNKITPEIKKAFLEEIKKTKYSGKEQGFLICLDKNGTFSASKKRCVGSECGLIVKDIHEYCPDRIQGGFHTHPYLINVEHFYGRKPTEKEVEHATKLYRKHFEKEGISLQTPSHHDLTDTLINQCIGDMEGTICTGNDLDLENVECWTIKAEKVRVRDCSQATQEHKERIAEKPKKWIKQLFDREVIGLK